MYVPAFQVLNSSMDKKIRYFRRYRKGSAHAKPHAAGLVGDSSEHVDRLGFLASLLYKLTNDQSGTISWGAG